MTLLLGIDTGGTFTDAVLVSAEGPEQVVASAKAPTTHHDLSIGIEQAVGEVLEHHPHASIGLVSMSTTLATNALVEGHGEPAGVIALGFDRADLARAGIADSVSDELIIALDGGHDAHGNERTAFPDEAVRGAATALADRVSAFAVVAQFSVRNPGHELAAAEAIRAVSGRPVTCSHELAARLDGPRRALTAALNARLLGTIERLNRSVAQVLDRREIQAPLMVVRGDGSLVSTEFAAARPIETILSGPAASVVGALHLSGRTDAAVVDIGGTTTDLALVRSGRPRVADRGAVVGGHATMVEAVEMASVGLGGDSEVRVDGRGATGPIVVGPQRAVPIGRLAAQYPGIVEIMQTQADELTGWLSHGRFLVATGVEVRDTLDDRERRVLDRLVDGPLPESIAAPSALEARAAMRLRARGAARISTVTPTDARVVVDGPIAGVDAEASRLAAALLARKPSSTGAPIATDADDLARRIVDRFVDESATFAITTALAADGIDAGGACDLIAAGLADGHRGASAVSVGLDLPIVAIGAPARSWYPAVAQVAGTQAVVPDHAEVANAVGAVVGQVRVRRSCTITQPSRGQYRAHLDDQPTFGSVDNARAAARRRLEQQVSADGLAAGAASPEITEQWTETTAEINGKTVFVEGTLTVEASARPRFGTD